MASCRLCYTVTSFAVIIIMSSIAIAAAPNLTGKTDTVQQYNLIIVFKEPVSSDVWRVSIILKGHDSSINCSGLLGPNVYYLQTRSISRNLVVAPLYYVLDKVCSQIISEIQILAGSSGNKTLLITIHVPDNYMVRSSMDWRSYGPTGGPYRVDLESFVRYYIFDGIVLANRRIYDINDYTEENLTVIMQRNIPEKIVKYALESLLTVRSTLTKWLGPSPRSPCVLVIVGPEEHSFLPPNTAHSMGSIVYIKLSSHTEDILPWLVHTVAHETSHGWFNHGMLYGDFSFQEAAAEFLAMKALHDNNHRLYRLAVDYLNDMLDVDEQYSVWMRVNAALWYAGIQACGRDVYIDTVRRLYNLSITAGLKDPISLLDVIKMMVEELQSPCGKTLEALVGRVLIAASTRNSTWPLIDISSLSVDMKTIISKKNNLLTNLSGYPSRESVNYTLQKHGKLNVTASIENKEFPKNSVVQHGKSDTYLNKSGIKQIAIKDINSSGSYENMQLITDYYEQILWFLIGLGFGAIFSIVIVSKRYIT